MPAHHPSIYERRLVDETVAAYVDWREECKTVRSTHEQWTAFQRADAGGACAAYLAALDREEAAADSYAALIAKLSGSDGSGLTLEDWGTWRDVGAGRPTSPRPWR